MDQNPEELSRYGIHIFLVGLVSCSWTMNKPYISLTLWNWCWIFVLFSNFSSWESYQLDRINMHWLSLKSGQDKQKRKCTIEQKKEIKLISILEVNLSGLPLRTRCWDWPLSQLRSCETDQVNPKKCRLRLSLWPFHKINFSIYKQLKRKLIGTVWLLYATVFL